MAAAQPTVPVPLAAPHAHAAITSRVTRELRGDRLRRLQLTAALAVDASLADAALDDVGWHILGGERAIDHLFRLRPDIERDGPIPWPTVHRQRYILSFAPTGVARGDGWHPLTVRLRARRGTVHAPRRLLDALTVALSGSART